MFFERPEAGERAVLVHLDLSDEGQREDSQEFQELVDSAGADALCLVTIKLSQPQPRFFIGSGKVEELSELVSESGAELVIFNHTLSPSQERNLEAALKCRVLDRTGLILDIFAQRARTHEGKLQVELAQLQHMSTRLVRGWTHLERQKGGIGLRGPGETQLETDRRLLRARIKSIEKRLLKVRSQREQGRSRRQRAEIPTLSLVGYTNAGKSSLFNALTQANVLALDQLFATLDPTLRRLELEGAGPVVLADTVGFIRHLPHKLVEAFRATLQETAEATLLLHVVDAYDERREDNIDQVNRVLEEIEADERPTLMVFNKIDLFDGFEPRIDRDDQGIAWRVWVSAQTGAGIPLLLEALAERLAIHQVATELVLAPEQGKLRARLYQEGGVIGERVGESGEFILSIRMPKRDYDRVMKRAS